MTGQIMFIIVLFFALSILAYSTNRILSLFKLTRKTAPIQNIRQRILSTIKVAILQNKIFRKRIIGTAHALVFWGFMVITLGSMEMVIDGIRDTERSFAFLRVGYDLIMGSGDIFTFIILICIFIFIARRLFFHIKRFSGVELKRKSKIDANLSLGFIFLLMASLFLYNISYVVLNTGQLKGVYPISQQFSFLLSNWNNETLQTLKETSWWVHMLLIFAFANYLPYSKHFHVFMSLPNVFLSSLDPLGKLNNMTNITREVKLILNPENVKDGNKDEEISTFGVKDVEDVTWKQYLDALTCTECGRCTDVCPANITGKKLSPRKLLINVRQRMNEKGRKRVKNKNYNDNKSLVNDYITEEELWACTTCNACVQECPLNINPLNLIVDMRRNLVMEENKNPPQLGQMFANIENNGSPWQFPAEDRTKWMHENETLN